MKKGRSDTAAVDSDHAEAKTSFLLSGKYAAGKSIVAQKYKNAGKVNGQKAMLLRDTGSVPPVECSTMRSRVLLMAKPTPCSLLSSTPIPCQKKV